MDTVGELWERYRVVVFSKIAPGTQRAYGYAWSIRVAPWFAHRPIDSITTLDVEEAFASWSGSEFTGGSADSGFAIYDILRFVACPVRTVVNGLCASSPPGPARDPAPRTGPPSPWRQPSRPTPTEFL